MGSECGGYLERGASPLRDPLNSLEKAPLGESRQVPLVDFLKVFFWLDRSCLMTRSSFS